MKKSLSAVFFLICLLSFSSNIFAVCDNNELNDWAEKVTLIWEVNKIPEGSDDWEEGTDESEINVPEYAYILKLSNYKDNIVVTATDSVNDTKYDVPFMNEFNSYTITSSVHFFVKTYNVEIYMKDDSPVCPGEKMKTLKYEVPAYNKYIYTTFCDENPNDENCKLFMNIDDEKEKEISTIIEEKEKEKELASATILEKIWHYVKTYGLYVLIPLVLVSTYYIVKIKMYKKKEDEL